MSTEAGYVGALKAAGATIEDGDVQYFGSYQGDILVKATVGGVTGFIRIGYGSCGGCDNYEASFGWDLRDHCDADGHYGEAVQGCDECQKAQARFNEALTKFGLNYVEDLTSAADLVAALIEESEWDSDANAMIDWVVARA